MSDATEEEFEIVDPDGNVLGLEKRSVFHGDPSLIHRVVHVLVFNNRGELLLQKRSMKKDVAPGRWDTSVGGHVNPGEDIGKAAKREMKEELGVEAPELRFLYRYLYSNRVESELVHTFSCMHEGPFFFSRDEIDEVRFWGVEEIRANLGRNVFSGHFEREAGRYLSEAKTPGSF